MPKEMAPFLENLIIAQLKEIPTSTGAVAPSLLTAASPKQGILQEQLPFPFPVLLDPFI